MSTRISRFALPLVAALGVAACGSRVAPPAYDLPPILINRDEIAAATPSVGAGAETRVVLQLRVDAEGRVQDVRIARSSGDADVDEAALWLGNQMRFQPAQLAGAPVAAAVLVPLRFDVVRRAMQPARLRNEDAVVALILEDYPELRGQARVRVRVGGDGRATVGEITGTDDEAVESARKLVEDLVFWPAYRGEDRIVAWCNVIFEFAGPESHVFIEPAGD
jgi:TonB family protein